MINTNQALSAQFSMPAPTNLQKILAFTHYMYGMKRIIRFRGMPGWEDFTPERWDSVAEHSYRMAVLAVVLAPQLKQHVDLLKTLKMIFVHDIVELMAHDYSPMGTHGAGGGHALDDQAFHDKYEQEVAASHVVFKDLPTDLQSEFQELFQEYINTKARPELATPEGEFAYALDKIEAVIQIADWTNEGYVWDHESFEKSMKYVQEWTAYDPVLQEFAKLFITHNKPLA